MVTLLNPRKVRNPMKKFKTIAICISLLATLSMTGCICTPGYYSGVSQYSYGYGGTVFNDPCDPCGPEMSCGTVEFAGNPCVPCPPAVNCLTPLTNIGTGVILVGRGVLDITAAPFVLAGKILSSGCQYEVIAHCPTVHHIGSVYQSVTPCSSPCSSIGTSGCDSCGDGHYGNGYIDDQSRTLTAPPVLRKSNTVIQAAHREPSRNGVKFVQPR